MDKHFNTKKKPKYLGITLDRTLIFKEHIRKNSAKLKTGLEIIQKLAGISWGADINKTRTSTIALLYSVAEYLLYP